MAPVSQVRSEQTQPLMAAPTGYIETGRHDERVEKAEKPFNLVQLYYKAMSPSVLL